MKDLNEGEFASKAHVFVPKEDQMRRGLGEVLQSKDWPMRMEGGREGGGNAEQLSGGRSPSRA